jgi:arginine repressor
MEIIAMPRGVPKKAAESGQVNRAELIRQTAKKMGKTVRPKDIVAALKEQGVTVSFSLVTKSLKRAGFHRKAQGKKAAALKRRGAKKSAAVTSHADGQINKAQRIRDVAKTLGKKVRPRDVIAELAKEGITVSSPQVSSTLAAAGYRRKRHGKRTAVAATAHPASGNGLNLEALIAAKALIQKVGGIEVAQGALAALKKLG